MARDETTAGSDQRAGFRTDLRRISDARTLRALAHPVRIAILETFALGGALTATEIGEQIGESPTTCSFHLRQLAKYGFVEEAGGGKGRARPWKMSTLGFEVARGTGDPEVELATMALAGLMRERQFARLQTWVETEGTYPKKWRKAATGSDFLLYLTAKELEALTGELLETILPRFQERAADPTKRPRGALPVELLLFAFPVAGPSGRS